MDAAPVYPYFKPVTLGDKPYFDAALRQERVETSDISFVSFYAWSEIEKNQFSCIDGLVIVKQTAGSGAHFYEPFGGGDKRTLIKKIIKEQGGEFASVSKATAQLFTGEDGFYVQPQREHFDYLYRVEDLATLAGEKYHAKRNLIHRFKESFDYEYVYFDHNSVRECLALEKAWCDIKDCDSDQGLIAERKVLQVLIDDFTALNLIAGGIKINGELCAMLIASPLNSDTLGGHIMKARADVKGLYQTMFSEFLIRQGGGFTYINTEDDLGIDGLRQAKLSYHPLRLVEKYKIGLRRIANSD